MQQQRPPIQRNYRYARIALGCFAVLVSNAYRHGLIPRNSTGNVAVLTLLAVTGGFLYMFRSIEDDLARAPGPLVGRGPQRPPAQPNNNVNNNGQGQQQQQTHRR